MLITPEVMYSAYEDSLTFSLKSTVSTTSEQGDKKCMHTQQRLDQVFIHHQIPDDSLSPSPQYLLFLWVGVAES